MPPASQLVDIERGLASMVSRQSPLSDPFVDESVRDVMLDTFGVAVAGSTETVVGLVREVFGEPEGSCPTVGASRRTTPMSAARINGVAAHALDFDDSVQPAMSHPSSVLVPALFSAGHFVALDGDRMIDAYWHGLKAFQVLGELLNPGHYEAGWHATSSLGRLAATVAVARAFALDETATLTALSIAVSSVGGARLNFGTMVKPLHAGMAAHDALAAALMARSGLSASSTPLSGRYGLVHLFGGSDGVDPGAALTALEDNDWRSPLRGLFIKPYAACGATQPTIEACVRLGAELDRPPVEIERVEVRVNPRVLQILSREEPRTGMASKFSLAHAAAVALVDGEGGLAQFTDQAVSRVDVARLRSRVAVIGDSGIGDSADWPCVVTVRLTDGEELSTEVARARGKWAGRRLTWDEVIAKFAANLLYAGADPLSGRKLIECIDRLRDLGFEELRESVATIRAEPSRLA